MMRRLTPDLLLLTSLIYAAGIGLVCLVAAMARG